MGVYGNLAALDDMDGKKYKDVWREGIGGDRHIREAKVLSFFVGVDAQSF